MCINYSNVSLLMYSVYGLYCLLTTIICWHVFLKGALNCVAIVGWAPAVALKHRTTLLHKVLMWDLITLRFVAHEGICQCQCAVVFFLHSSKETQLCMFLCLKEGFIFPLMYCTNGFCVGRKEWSVNSVFWWSRYLLDSSSFNITVLHLHPLYCFIAN